MKKTIIFLCCLLLGTAFSLSAPAKADPFPEALRFKQVTTEREYHHSCAYAIRTYPETACETVNGEMRALIDEMNERALPFLPRVTTELMPSYLDTGAVISRTGSKWMSFLTISRIAKEREQIYVDFDARAYDMETGRRLCLADVLRDEDAVWNYLAREIAAQLNALFDGQTADADALRALCAKDAIASTPFVLTPARLTFLYRADALYETAMPVLMRVDLYYPALSAYMTEEALLQTDNSAHRAVALTFDDGPARSYTLNVMNELRRYGANATFFSVGSRLRDNHDVIARESDAGYTVASHNYEHIYEGVTVEKILHWRDRFSTELNGLIGRTPAMMRAPGGKFGMYQMAQVGLPLIQWSVNPGDAGTGADAVKLNADNVISASRNGSVVLMHDINSNCYAYTQLILERFEERGILCVSVDELFSMLGIPLEPNAVYYSADRPEEEK